MSRWLIQVLTGPKLQERARVHHLPELLGTSLERYPPLTVCSLFPKIARSFGNTVTQTIGHGIGISYSQDQTRCGSAYWHAHRLYGSMYCVRASRHVLTATSILLLHPISYTHHISPLLYFYLVTQRAGSLTAPFHASYESSRTSRRPRDRVSKRGTCAIPRLYLCRRNWWRVSHTLYIVSLHFQLPFHSSYLYIFPPTYISLLSTHQWSCSC
jgi:hypothetical protein